MVFDSIVSTHDELRDLPAFPTELINRFNDGRTVENKKELLMNDEFWSMVSELDDHAIHALKTTVLVEYARCKEVCPGVRLLSRLMASILEILFLKKKRN